MTRARVAAASAVVAVIIVTATTALAHPAGVPRDDGELSRWFERQRSVAGGWCCDLSDAYYLGDDDWVAGPSGYRVRLGGAWYDVPPGALRDATGDPNPTGQAILWYYAARSGLDAPVIWCFAPGTSY